MELKKKNISPIELSLSQGKRQFEEKTGWIHRKDPKFISLLDNAYFVLALFKSRQVSQMQEGLELLNRLLAFQGEDGGFPFYIHDYGKSHFFGSLRLLVPLFWLDRFWEEEKIFRTKKKGLEKLVSSLLTYCQKQEKKAPLPDPLCQILRALSQKPLDKDFFSFI